MHLSIGRRLILTPQLFAAAAFYSASPQLLKIGNVLRESRQFTKSDVVRYSEVSGDRNPIHLDDDFSLQVTGFDRGCIVHGLLVASLFPSIIASSFPGAVYVSQTLQFKLPVYVDDEVVAETEAKHIRTIKDKYYVKWLTRCYTSSKSLVVDGEAASILPTIALR